MLGAKERLLRRRGNTPQGGAIEGNTTDDALMAIRVSSMALTGKARYLRFTLRVKGSMVEY